MLPRISYEFVLRVTLWYHRFTGMVEPVSVPAVRWMDKQWVQDALTLHAADRHVRHDACFGNIGWQFIKRANGLHEIRPHAHCSAAQS